MIFGTCLHYWYYFNINIWYVVYFYDYIPSPLCVLHIKPFFLLVDIQHTQCPQCDPPTHPTTYLTHPPIREPTIHNSYTHHQPMHEPPCVYNNRTAVQNRAAETHPLTTHKPTMTLNCAYNSTAVQPYSRKKKKKKEAESGV